VGLQYVDIMLTTHVNVRHNASCSSKTTQISNTVLISASCDVDAR